MRRSPQGKKTSHYPTARVGDKKNLPWADRAATLTGWQAEGAEQVPFRPGANARFRPWTVAVSATALASTRLLTVC